MQILSINTRDITGGAAQIAWQLHQGYRQRRCQSWLAVSEKQSDDPYTVVIPHLGKISQSMLGAASKIERRHPSPLASALKFLAEPCKHWELRQGHENFHYAGSRDIEKLVPIAPEIIHAHNLHGDYFDLHQLPQLSQRAPLVLTLHDAWLLSGHCAHSLSCDRWQIGCGHCPDLRLYPAIRRDATAFNWQRKAQIYQRSKLYITTPCQWLMNKVEHSMLAPAVVDARVIPNGVDLNIFKPAPKAEVRDRLGLPQDALILLFSAEATRRNPWKDYAMLHDAVGKLSAVVQTRQVFDQSPICFVVLGDDGPTEQIGNVEVRHVGYQSDRTTVANYYQGADLYLHAAKADTFPTSILEALACGVPVVATAVGGIPEQVEEGVTGFIVPQGDSAAMAERILKLIDLEPLRHAMSQNAHQTAKRAFSVQRMVDQYLSWYAHILHHCH
ncbi:MAG: glycosyltransferase [Moorea sp. SIOASIH]|uniref:glycosyltransferase n=1 Tax=Moorena sp. SIOASIH TaxID=2607817 RepID=UPI0013B896EC|nr:glycosyltransferase [Moorena sp. SIOASIH]NEO38551.1 glycosyltransferase [Moorena sp. SIOASIH]